MEGRADPGIPGSALVGPFPVGEYAAAGATRIAVNAAGDDADLERFVAFLAREVAPRGTRFYLFSSCDDSKLRALARELKADGWLSKSTPVAEVSKKLRDLATAKGP